jgi:hypothetical protein
VVICKASLVLALVRTRNLDLGSDMFLHIPRLGSHKLTSNVKLFDSLTTVDIEKSKSVEGQLLHGYQKPRQIQGCNVINEVSLPVYIAGTSIIHLPTVICMTRQDV